MQTVGYEGSQFCWGGMLVGSGAGTAVGGIGVGCGKGAIGWQTGEAAVRLSR